MKLNFLPDAGLRDFLATFPPMEVPEQAYKISDNSIPGAPTAISFLPSYAYDKPAIRKRLEANLESKITYRLPFPSVTTNPEAMREYLDKMYEDASRRIQQGEYSSLSIAGVSFGNALAYKIANEHEAENLFSVTPGANLFRGVFTSLATKKVHKEARENGVTHAQYLRALNDYNPEKNLKNLPQDITVDIGIFDFIVPYQSSTIPFIEELEDKGYNPKINLHKSKGHVGVLRNAVNPY
ncbi:MAG: hypothetical protein ACI83O_000842 [Patescibacteria group bacterium]|jgi:hypothetical protein